MNISQTSSFQMFCQIICQFLHLKSILADTKNCIITFTLQSKPCGVKLMIFLDNLMSFQCFFLMSFLIYCSEYIFCILFILYIWLDPNWNTTLMGFFKINCKSNKTIPKQIVVIKLNQHIAKNYHIKGIEAMLW